MKKIGRLYNFWERHFQCGQSGQGDEDVGFPGDFDEEEPSAEKPRSAVDHWQGLHGEISIALSQEGGGGVVPEVDAMGVATACLEKMMAAGLRLDMIAEAMVSVETSGVRRGWEEWGKRRGGGLGGQRARNG